MCWSTVQKPRNTIVTIDDDACIRMWMEHVLQKKRFPSMEIQTAATLQEALEIIEARRDEIMLLISDGHLDRSGTIHGVEITSKAVESGIPLVVLYSAFYGELELHEQVIRFKKPMIVGEMAAAIQQHCQERGLTMPPHE